MKRALITGIAGQDGSYLAELLVSIGYEVHGVVRKEALEGGVFGLSNLRSVIDKIHLHGVSIDNHQSLSALVSECDPHECYHLASESYVSHDLNDGHELVSTMFSRSHALISSIKNSRSRLSRIFCWLKRDVWMCDFFTAKRNNGVSSSIKLRNREGRGIPFWPCSP